MFLIHVFYSLLIFEISSIMLKLVQPKNPREILCGGFAYDNTRSIKFDGGINTDHILRWNYYKNTKEINLWPQGVIPYNFGSGLRNKDKKLIQESMNRLQKKTCLRFREKENSDRDYVSFRKSSNGCWASIGKSTGRNWIHLDEVCLEKCSEIIHQIMHTLGFFDQHNIRDRDTYIKVMWENIIRSKVKYFDIPNARTIDLQKPYDYNSIMHLNLYSYSSNEQKTMIPRKNIEYYLTPKIGDLSRQDLFKIRKFYCVEYKVSNKSADSGVETPEEFPEETYDINADDGTDKVALDKNSASCLEETFVLKADDEYDELAVDKDYGACTEETTELIDIESSELNADGVIDEVAVDKDPETCFEVTPEVIPEETTELNADVIVEVAFDEDHEVISANIPEVIPEQTTELNADDIIVEVTFDEDPGVSHADTPEVIPEQTTELNADYVIVEVSFDKRSKTSEVISRENSLRNSQRNSLNNYLRNSLRNS